MPTAKKENYSAKRGALVVKANEIIQRSRFQLSTNEQKIVLFLISQINPIIDSEFKEYEFSIQDFCKVCGIKYGGASYSLIKEQIQNIADKSLWIELDNGTETLIRWIAKARIDKTGFIRIKLDDDLKPYLLQLMTNFTKYQLLYTLKFKCKYSIRLFELAHSIHFDKTKPYTRRFELEQFKQLLGAETYTDYKDFRKRVLKPAVEEINKYSDISIEVNRIMNGHSIVALELSISSKNEVELVFLKEEIDKELGSPQVSIWELAGETIREESRKDETDSQAIR